MDASARGGEAAESGPPGIRLQKLIAAAGVASRRAAEELIASGQVTVNGRTVTEPGARAEPQTDEVRVRGQLIGRAVQTVYVALNKPTGYVTTASDERGRSTVMDLLPEVVERVYPVGRLDLDSEGLLLLTNDGELTARLTHPRYGVEKEYRVLVSPMPSEPTLAALRSGVVIDGHHTAPARARRLIEETGRTWLEITIHEGRKRQVRLMCASLGLTVHRLVRTRFGSISLADLALGRCRALTPAEVESLRLAVGLVGAPPAAHPRILC